MVFWSCSIFEVSPNCNRAIFDSIWQKRGGEYEYEVDEETGEKLTLYIDEIMQNNLGSLVEMQFDIFSPPIYIRGRPSKKVLITTRIAMQVFYVSGFPNMVGVFGRQDVIEKFRWALRKIYSNQSEENSSIGKQHILNQIVFSLREREECLMKKFPDMKELAIDSIKDFHVSKAVLKGHDLEESPLFEQWVKDDLIGGKVKYFGFYIRGETIITNTFGTINSRQGREKRPYETVYHLLKSLLECKAVKYQSAISDFF